MGKVYVVQNQMRFDRTRSTLVPRFPELESIAAKYGEVHFLLSPSAGPWNTESVLADLRRGLAAYRGDEDYLLLIGNPALIGFAVAIASQRSDRVSLLQWNGKDGAYVPVKADLRCPDPENLE